MSTTDRPIESVAAVAATAAQAKVFVALLAAEGIPAHTDGDSLTDEFAASRRLMNLMGTKVLVPTPSLERAREILQPSDVDAEELTRQALAAGPAEPPSRPIERADSAAAVKLWLVAATGALLLVWLLTRAF
jgi:hypothetical protein